MLNHIPRKRFGQNFLHDNAIIGKIIAAIAPKPDELMVEIGPGQAALTSPLLEKLHTLHAIELDRDLIPLLTAQYAEKGLVIHQADALQFDFATLFHAEKPLRVVGNLPYNISTPLIFHLLRYQQHIKDMHFMLQAEVVDRLAAAPNSKDYGRLSVITQYFCQVDRLFYVPPGAFNPPPKVMSAIVRLKPRVLAENAKDLALFEKLVKVSFAQRRKTLRNNLKHMITPDMLAQLDVDLRLRPEQLSVADYVQLSNQLSALGIC